MATESIHCSELRNLLGDKERYKDSVRIGDVLMKTQIQKTSNHGNMKSKEAVNTKKTSIGVDDLVKHESLITHVDKTVDHQNITKPTARINKPSYTTTPDGQTKYGPDGLTPNGMTLKEIEKMDRLFCVEKKSEGVHDRDDILDARQSNHNDKVSFRRINSPGRKSFDKKHKGSKVHPEKANSGIIGRITSALGVPIPVNKGNTRRDDAYEYVDAHVEGVKMKGREPRDKTARKKDKSKKKKKESCSRVFYPKNYAPVAEERFSREPADKPDGYSTSITGPSVTGDKVPHTTRSDHQMFTLTKELDLTAARATNIRVLATKDWPATGTNEISLRKGTIIKQKRAMNSLGMAFGWKKTRYGVKKDGYYPSSAVTLYPTEENYARLGLTLSPSVQ